MEIKFRADMDTEDIRECLEDNLGVEILNINSNE